MFSQLLCVAVGSAAGGVLRFLVARYLPAEAGRMPWATLIVNAVGCFLIGWLSAWAARHVDFSPALRLLLVTGFCGGFTTFSTFMAEEMLLLRGGHLAVAALYVSLSLLLGMLCYALGTWLVRMP